MVLMITGCSDHNAFNFFKIDKEHQLALDWLRTGTFARSFETEAILSTVYLNKVMPKKYHGNEFFFVALYLENDRRLWYKKDLNEPDVQLFLNGSKPLKITQLDRKSRLRAVMPIQNEWNRYYLIEYPKQENGTLVLDLISTTHFGSFDGGNDQFHLVQIEYELNELD